jgi:hypothetical protein
VSTVIGGRRVRFIRDSARFMVRDALEERGWLATGRRHLPIQIIPAPNDWDEPLALNTLAVSMGDVDDSELELGSNLTEDRHGLYLDFFAESETLGLEVAHDLRDILRGKVQAIGRTRPIIEVFDWSLATPAQLFVCQIQNVAVDRAQGFSDAWRKNWFSVSCDVVDEYGDDLDE